MIEGGLYSVTALRETWARRRCILNTRIYHKQASTTSKAHFTRRSSSSSGSHSACQLPWHHPCAASSASVASSAWGASASEWAVAARPAWPSASPGPSVGRPCQSTVVCPGPQKGRGCLPPSLPLPLRRLLRSTNQQLYLLVWEIYQLVPVLLVLTD